MDTDSEGQARKKRQSFDYMMNNVSVSEMLSIRKKARAGTEHCNYLACK